jgi:3alpha(or 20beta)-hydroxysteroid dehydrogenase
VDDGSSSVAVEIRGNRGVGTFDGKIAVVTGAAMGMGYATADLLVDRGASVIVADVAQADGEAAAKRLGERAFFYEHDVADESSWDRLVAWTVEHRGGVDVLVNNAAIWRTAPIAEQSTEEFDRMVAVNLRGTFLGMRSVVEPMRARGGGAIVNMSSFAGIQGVARMVAYSATKWAVRGMTKSAALDLAREGIRVNSVHPGSVDTPMIASLGFRRGPGNAPHVPIGRIAAPEEVARAVVFLCSSEADFITGAELCVDGGASAGRPPA